MLFCFLTFILSSFARNICTVRRNQNSKNSVNQKIYIILAFNFDPVIDEHGDHDYFNFWNELNHLRKKKEYGVLFGFF